MIDNLHDEKSIEKKLSDLEILNKLRRNKKDEGALAYLLLIYASIMKYQGKNLGMISDKLFGLYRINHHSYDINTVQLVLEKNMEHDFGVLHSWKIIGLLKITDEEQKSLETIITKKERNYKDYRKSSEERKQLTKIKKEILAENIQKLHKENKSYNQIKDELGISKGTVHNYLVKYKLNK